MLIEEINARKAEIKSELGTEGITEERIAELETEVAALEAEERKINEAAEERKALEQAVISAKTETIETEKKEEVKTMDYRSAWLKNLQGAQLTEEERTAITATAAIPTETMNKVIGVLERSPLLAAIDITHIPSNVSYPIEGTVNDAAWVDMGTAATDSADTYGTLSLAAYKLIKTIEVTADVTTMAIDAFEDYLVERLANKLKKTLDIAVLTGNGSSKATGIKTTKATADTTYTSTGPTYNDICNIIGALPSEYHDNASFVMKRDMFFGKVLSMQATGGERIVVADAQAPAKFNILGYPVIVDDNCYAGDILFGDFKAYKLNFAKDPVVESDDSVGFRTGSRVWRAMALVDGKLGDKNAIVRAVAGT